MITSDMEITDQWITLNEFGETTIVAPLSGLCLFRFSESSTSNGMSLTETIVVDKLIQVKALGDKAVIAVSQ